MFVVVYRYQVPVERMKRYVQFEKQATQIYMEHGCLGVEIYRDAKDPGYWMEINKFKDKRHYQEVVTAIQNDSRISQMTKEFMSLFEPGEYKPEKRAYFRMI